jgi:hypothetical protein
MTKVRADRTVIVIGVFLFILGLAVAWNGYGYVRDERGWTLVISGTVVFSSGLLLVALGFVLRELRAIAASAGRATLLLAKAKTLQLKDFDEDSFPAAPPPVPAAPPPLPPRAFEPEEPAAAAFAPAEEEFETPAEIETKWKVERTLRLHLPRVDEAAAAGASLTPNPLAWMVRPEKAQPAPPPPIPDEDFESWEPPQQPEQLAQQLQQPPQEYLREPPVETLHVAEMPAEPPEAEDLSGSLDAPEPAPQPEAQFAPEHEPAHVMEPAPETEPEPEPEIELAPEPEPEPDLVPETEPEHELEPAPPATAAEEAAAEEAAVDEAAPEVIGHYEAHGAHYTMYADGSIDADTTHGVYRFASMEELKQFIARQE